MIIRHRHTGTPLFQSSHATIRDTVKATVSAGADLRGADLTDANLTRADLTDANLAGADLRGADLTDANLTRADLTDANLAGADLRGADLRGADLTDANLAGSDLTDANLTRADLTDANLAGARLPDGRTWETYRLDPLAGICAEPDAVQRAVDAWGNHRWTDCPMHAACGWRSIADAPADRRIAVACFVALFDAHLLPAPAVAMGVGP